MDRIFSKNNIFQEMNISTEVNGYPDSAIEAATTIQRNFRGRRVRKPFLPRDLFSKYHPIIKESEYTGMARASGGSTKVYLPENLPIVLKESGSEKAKERFFQMQKVRAVLELQGSSCLIIPKARRCGDFLVEERLQIAAEGCYGSDCYCSDPKLFDNAVREMTRLFSKIYISDLISSTYPFSIAEGVDDNVRYDNLPLYIEGGEGRIGLVDLERFQDKPNPRALEILVRIFPLHLEVIKKEANQMDMQIDNDALEKIAEKGKRYLHADFIYEDHVEWFKQRGVSIDCPYKRFEISPERKKTLVQFVESQLIKMMNVKEKRFFEVCERAYGENVKNEIADLWIEGILEGILSNLGKNISESRFKAYMLGLREIQAEIQLSYVRSLLMSFSNICLGVAVRMYHLCPSYEDPKDEKPLAEQLTELILEELVRGGELFHFSRVIDPKQCWIRY